MSKDWDSLSRKEKKDAAQSTLEMLEQKKKTEMNPLLHLFYLKRIRTLWIYLKKTICCSSNYCYNLEDDLTKPTSPILPS